MASRPARERWWQLAIGPAMILAWEVAVRAGWLDARLVGLPSAIAARLVREFATGRILWHLGVTVSETVLGFAAGAIAGVICGLLLARFGLVRLTLMPYLEAVYAIPRPALAPLFVLWFGVGFTSKLILVITLVYFVFLLHVLAGLQTTDPKLVDWLRTLGATRGQILQQVGVPHLLPWLFAATKLGLALALIGAIVGEFISSRAGLGFLMLRAADQLDTEGVLAGVVLLSALVMLVMLPLGTLERRLFRWQPDVHIHR